MDHFRNLYRRANEVRGCLSGQRQATSRRRFESDADYLMLGDPFQIDKIKLLGSKRFRLLAQKTQVFTLTKNPLIRTRQTHVLETVACALMASEILGLNSALCEAIGLGHDIGHVPFGHQGEMWMQKAMAQPHFCHEVMGPIVAQKIERTGNGLNLTYEVLEGMMRHSGNTVREGMSQEAWLFRFCDKIAYIFGDVNDIFVRSSYPMPPEITSLLGSFGDTQRQRTSTAIAGLVLESAEKGRISFEHSELGMQFTALRKLMYQIYPRVTQQNVSARMENVAEFLEQLQLCDTFLLLALMTDRDVVLLSSEPMKDMSTFNQCSVSEIVPYLQTIGPIDLLDPGLDW